MEIRQKRLSHRTRYVFGDERLDYEWQDPSGSRSFSVDYTQIGRDRQTLVERNAWLRNAGLFWMVLGLFLSVLRYVDQHSLVPSVWLPVGIGCLIAYRLRTLHFTIVPTEKGNLMVVGDDHREQILDEMGRRRSDALRREYDFFPEGEEPEQLRRRFRWLHEEGVLDAAELARRLRKIDEHDVAVQAVNRLLSSQ